MPRKVSENFPFDQVAGRTFKCVESQDYWWQVTAKDKSSATKGEPDQMGSFTPPYWDVPCPTCSGTHRFYPDGSSTHLPKEC